MPPIHSTLASFPIAMLHLEDVLYQSTAIALLIPRPQTLIFKDYEQFYYKFIFYHTFVSLLSSSLLSLFYLYTPTSNKDAQTRVFTTKNFLPQTSFTLSLTQGFQRYDLTSTTIGCKVSISSHGKCRRETTHFLEPTTAHISLDLGTPRKVPHLQVGSVPDLFNLHLDSADERRQFRQPSVQTLASPCHTTQDDRPRLLPILIFFAMHRSPKFCGQKPLSLRTSHSTSTSHRGKDGYPQLSGSL